MRHLLPGSGVPASILFGAALWFTILPVSALAQGSVLQQKVAAIEAAVFKNEQMLGQYTWQQQETVSVRGSVKKTALYQVQLGPNGKPVKTVISQSQPSDQRKFGIRHRITQDYIAYGQQVASLAAGYTQLQPNRLKQLYAQGDVSLKSGGAPGLDSIVITNYVKPGDSVALTFNRAQKTVVAMHIQSYLSGPSDVVTIAAQFAKLPDGTNHVSTVTVNGESMSLTVQDVNLNYQKRT
jgi:hypothetical protein